MAWFVAAKMEYVVVEMVENVVVEMGYLVEKEEEEEGGGGGIVVVVVVGMEEEMEEKVMEKLVVEEMEKGGEDGRPKEGTMTVLGCCFRGLLAGNEGRKEK